METVTLLYEDYQKELAEDFKNTFLKRASDTDSSRSNDAVIDEVTDMLSTNIAVYTEKLLRQWGFSSGGEGGSGGGDVTVTLDDLLQKYLEDNYVTIKGDQEVYGEKDFRKGIRIAGRRLYWDESNDALVIEGAAYTTRWLSAYGMSPGGGGAGSGGAAAMYQLIDVSPNDTKDAVLGAEKDYVLTFDGNFWRGMPNKGGLSSKLFTALDKDGNEVNPDDENSEIYAIRANYSLWSVGFLSAKGISDGGAGGGGGGAVALYQLLDVEKNSDITGVAGATKGSVLTFNGDKWYADKPKTAEGINRLFSALDADGNEVDLNDESKLGTITNIRANYALWSVDWISAKGKSSGGSGGGGGLISLVYGFESLGGTFDNNDNTATFNAFTINEIWKLASSGLTNVTVTGSGNAVTDVTKGSDGRSLTFTKGNMFASKSEFDALNTKFNDFLTGSDADDIINKWSELEVFLQGMKESDNLAVILQSKMDKSAFNKLFSALDSDGNEIDPSDDTKTVAAIRANFGFWGVDYVSAKGVSKGSGGTGGASALYQLVDVLANDTGDGVDGAVAGKALVFDGTHWKAADAGLNESQLSAFLSLNGYLTQTAADGRYVTSARKVIAGTGLSGGGSLTSDVTLSLGTSGVVAGTYTKVMVDVYGRVTSGTSLSATDIPSLDWSKITTGKPTTLAGYGITDAYSKTEADGKYVTIATAQTISGAKTFSAVTKTASVLPSADANSELGGTANRWNNIYSVNGTFSQNVTAKLLSASETLQIGDAYLKWDSTNNAVYVIKKDGTTPVGFYSTDWLSAKGVSMSGVQTGTLADLTDVEITNPTNGQALKYDAISQKWVNGTIDSFNVNQMWTELTKADSSKVIDASHIPTSVLDNRWVKKAGDTMTGTLTSASTTGSIIFKGLENCDITNIYTNNGTLYSDTNLAIRNGLRFNWYDTYWYIGNLRGAGTNSSGFGIANESNKLCLQVTPDYTTAPVFRSSASQGTAPLIVYSTTQVSNLNADLLDDKHGAYYQNRVYDTFVSQYTQYDYIEFLRFVIPSGQNQLRAYVVFDLCRTETGNESSGRAVLRLRRNTNNTAGTLFYVTNFGRSTLPELRCTSDDGITWRIWMKCNKSGYDPYIAVKIVEQYPYGYVTTQNNGTTGTPEGTRHVFTALSAGISNAANFLVNSRTLWGQPFNGTANVSGDMTGVGSITMSGDLKIGNATSPNTIYFYGTTGDGPGGYNHTFIAERLWGGTQSGELVLFKGNDIGNGTDAITASNSGPDRIRHIAAAHLFQTYTTALSGSVESVCTSSALKNLFSIASNRVISYVQLQSTIASGVAPFIVASNTVVSNLNADLLDGQHLSDLDGRYVNVTGDTMTGDLTMNNTKGFNIGWSTRVAKNSGVWIHGGANAASSTDANLRFASWYGIGWYPTIDTASGVRQGNNAMWLNVRYGNLNVAGGIKESTICIGRVNSSGEYDAAYNGEINRYDHHLFLQHHSGKYLIMCTGGGLAGIGTNSPGEKLHVAGNTRTDGYFRSTVGTGTQPYQCSSTTLNTNLNADLLDGYHQTAFTSIIGRRTLYTSGTAPYNYIYLFRIANSSGYSTLRVDIDIKTRYHRAILYVDIVSGQYAYGDNGTSVYISKFQVNGQSARLWYKITKQTSGYNYIDFYYQSGAWNSGSFDIVSRSSNGALVFEPKSTNMDNLPSGCTEVGNTVFNGSTTGNAATASRLQTARNINGTTFDGTANITTSYWGTTRTFYTNSHDSYRVSSGVNVNGSGNVTLLLPNSIRCSDWFRSTGNSGWYHENYGGGWYMTDSSYIRNYNSKRLRIQTDTYDTIQLVRTSGSGGSSIAFYNGGGTFRGQFGMNAASWFTFDTGTATANQNVVEISPAGGIHSKAEITAKASGSDIRLKKDIQNYNAMDIINKFRSVKYHWNDVAKANSEVYNNDYDQFGLIAQDLIAGGFKQWVRDVFHDYYTVTYERLIPVVWKGLQEVDDEVTKLRKEVVRLNKRISELEKFLCA
nr:MAG: chaperone of endosialidase [Bacteriophage sp.]